MSRRSKFKKKHNNVYLHIVHTVCKTREWIMDFPAACTRHVAPYGVLNGFQMYSVFKMSSKTS